MSEYQIYHRGTTGFGMQWSVYRGEEFLGAAQTLWGARRIISKDRTQRSRFADNTYTSKGYLVEEE